MSDLAFSLSVPADAAYLAAIRAFFDHCLRPRGGDATDSLVLALDEACANVIRHRDKSLGCASLDVRAELSDAGLLRIRLGSFCAQSDVAKIKPRDLSDVRPGGLGTHFIEKIMDRVAYEPEPGRPERLALVMEKALAPAKSRSPSPRGG